MGNIERNDVYTKKESRFASISIIISGIIAISLMVLYVKVSSDYLSILFVVLMFIPVLPLSIAFHELGHLIFGLLSGYKFISYQFLFFKVVNNNGKKKISFEKSPLLGQCLMGIDVESKDKIKYKAYQLGGSIVNLILSLSSVIIIALFYLLNGQIIYLLIPVFYINMYLYISNGIPLNLNGVYNDALNLRLMNKYEDARKSMINILVVQYLESNNYSIADIPDEVLNNDDINTPAYFIHSYPFSYYRTVKRLINKEEDPFKEIIEWNMHEYELPLQYKLQNYELLAFKRLVNNELYEYIFKLKICEKMFKNERSEISKLDNILYGYRNNAITKEEALNKIDYLDELTIENGYLKLDAEFFGALRSTAKDYILGLYPVEKEIKEEENEETQSTTE